MRRPAFLVAGGDLRQLYTARALLPEGSVSVLGFDENVNLPEGLERLDSMELSGKRADYLVLPMPVTEDGVLVHAPFARHSIPVAGLPGLVKADGAVFGGRIHPAVRKVFDGGAAVVDYYQREELSVLNAVPTAEGAIQIAMEELATTIYGQNVLVTGFGRISKVLVRILTAMGAHVTVTARKYQDLAWAEISGCRAVHISRLEETLPGYDLVFNTVPAVLLDEARLWKLRSDALIIDLASKPGGVDFDTASRLGRKTVWALSLPGKVAPITAGDMIACTIRNILKERSFADD
ncbi:MULTISPECIES: dipicolinate synthase subunit DpsA [Ruminococcus]|uniref:D-isomer specific 2-hydroxyacid dehydrogenase, NAD binding domain n=1 Tax=Ruminococcus champanellensis (strain DSM 18848 / JCM 17042 / KCTC 15320 / 18P13) TaxID=213810 RepID=D4LAS4_RUMC1|nr:MULTISPECIES: dipicolinate synthase subunit DpsA [Ruminococcus]MED9892507.1 dipicolinate synthase subunit DpsA [Ruminococcus champanellensis]CBL16719.1 D-isomer specific 2-hydroxyacid dehydrogenase, NAD binding domain [Ruminococcus champanellensis 18P13 = JCM 17042]CDD53796.1 d-isomer specific 2-hydroxyacid dehydrogenase NAD binding domain [Ruminococcus sp. CAG:379]